MSLLRSAAAGFAEGLAGASSTAAEKERAYRDRNLLAVALAARNHRFAGYYYDDEDPEWPVVWVELPAQEGKDRFAREQRRQVSWHVSPDLQELVEDVLEEQRPPQGFDGHSRTEKNQRLVEFATDA